MGKRIGGFIDVETTGLNYEKDEIIEFAIVLFSYCPDADQIEIINEYRGLREPDCSIKKGATEVHGMTKRQLKGLCLDDEIIMGMIAQAEFLISHNASFDFNFVYNYIGKTSLKPWYCSMNGISWRRYGFQSKALQNLLKDHNIEVEQAHRALGDVKAALALLSKENKKGKTYFSELINNPPAFDGIIISYKEIATTKEEYIPAKPQYTSDFKQNNKKQNSGCTTVLFIFLLLFIIYLLMHI